MYIYGDQTVSVPENLSFSQFMLDRLRAADGDNICLENGLTRESLTYKKAVQYAVKLSVALSNLGLQKGDVVAIGSKPFLHYIPTVLAVVFAGATFTTYEESLEAADLKHKLKLAKPKYLICSSTFWRKHNDLILGYNLIKTYIAVDDGSHLKISLTSLVSMSNNVDVETFDPVPVQTHSDIVMIGYSTGTTNLPKGIKRSHYNELSSVVLRGFEKMKLASTVLIAGSWTPRFYIANTFKILSLGRKIFFMPAWNVKRTLQIIKDCKVNAIFGTSEYFRELANSSQPTDNYFDSLKIIISGGTSLRAEMVERFQKSFPNVDIKQVYGSTECDTISRFTSNENKPASVGQICPGVIIKVVEFESRALLGPNQIGEICVKSPTVAQGYINLNIAEYMDEDNFFMTGDLGYYDEDNYLFFVERNGNFIRWNDHKVSPGELENVILQHPAVYDVVVMGKPAPVVKEVPVAFVVKKSGIHVSEEELIEFVASKVSAPMQLRGGVIFISEIPKSEGGKPKRLELRKCLI